VPLPVSPLLESRDALDRAACRLADVLRSLPDTDATVPGSSWTVGDTAAHVVISLRHATLVAARRAVPWAEGATSTQVAAHRIAELNTLAMSVETERGPQALAGLLLTAVDDYLAGTATLPPDRPMHSPYYLGEIAPDHAGLTGIQLSEVLVHGYDIANVTGRPWPIAADEARLALRAAVRLTPAFVDPEIAHGHTGGYDLWVRGGPRVVFRFTDGRVSLEEPGVAPVDCHVLAEPVALLLLMYGRIPQWMPIASGRLIPWGRRPWRALGFRQMFVNP
jgi:uncharacterized protein (TIGR03083 family)